MRSAALSLLGAVLVLSACAIDPLNTDPEVRGLRGTGITNLGDPGEVSDVDLRPGESFRLAFDANATTGYSWALLPEYSETVIELTGDEYRSNSNPFGMVGVGGTQYFQLRALASGETQLRFVYSRSRNAEDAVEERLLNVSVSE